MTRPRARTNRRARQLQPIYNPLQPLQGRTLKQAAGALTNLEIRPQVSMLSRQIANINRQGQQVQDRTNDYYTNLGQFGAQAQQGQRSATDRLNSTLAGIGQNTQAQLAGFGQQAQGAMQSQAANGLDGGSWDMLAREVAAQQGLAAQGSEASRTLGATQGSNWEGLSSAIAQTDAMRGRERLGEIANVFGQAAAEPMAKKADLLSSRGSLFTRNLGALRDSEREYSMGIQALGLQGAQAAADAAGDRADRRLRARQFSIETAMKDANFQLDLQKFGLDAARDNYQRSHGLGPYRAGARSGARPLNRDQVNAAFADIDAARTAVDQLRRQGLGTGAIRQALANGYYPLYGKDANGRRTMRTLSVPRVGDRVLVNAAMDLAVLGHLSPANVRALHRFGLKIRGRYRYLKGHQQPAGGVGPPSPVYG